ncbi:MAG: TolC family protein [Terracidiphilus sp.]|nr:TolC family protein [Terracidiphilus sp.]
MRRKLSQAMWLLLSVALAAGASAMAQQPLTLRQAIEQALKQNPDVAVARAGVDEAHAGTAMAKSALLPQVSFTEDMSRGNDPVYAFGTRLRQQRFTQADFALNALNTPDAIGNFSSRISGGWQVFDSLKTQRQIRGAKLMERSASSQAGAVDQKIVFSVVAAYQQVLYAEREVATAQHEAATAEALLKSADDHVKAGLAVESDRMAAQVNLAACRQTLIAAEGEREMAWAGLRLAMGAPEFEATSLVPLEARSYPATALADDVTLAAKNRKDLAAMGDASHAQAAATSAARLALGPRVNAYGNWENDRNTLASSGGSNWVAGVQIAIDLQPMTRRAQLAQQQAARARVEAQVESYRQQVRMQVSQAHTQRATAQQSMETAKAAVDQAAESLRIVKNRYEAGLATITDLLRAEDAERQSQTNYWRAVYGNTVAYAQLLFTTGTLTPEAAEELQ